MPRSSEALEVFPEQRRTLESWVRAHNTPQSIVLRAKIVLLAADGWSNVQVARQVGTSRPTVILWRHRFLQGGPNARMRASSIEINHNIKNNVHTFIIKHDLGENWSIYHTTVLELIFREVLEKKADFEYNAGMMSFKFTE